MALHCAMASGKALTPRILPPGCRSIWSIEATSCSGGQSIGSLLSGNGATHKPDVDAILSQISCTRDFRWESQKTLDSIEHAIVLGMAMIVGVAQ